LVDISQGEGVGDKFIHLHFLSKVVLNQLRNTVSALPAYNNVISLLYYIIRLGFYIQPFDLLNHVETS
jgi:hypothetical protein